MSESKKVRCEVPENGWTCFHCGETFHDVAAAAQHFGNDLTADPGCVMKLRGGEPGLVTEMRQLLEELRRYQEDDQPIMRELYALGSKHAGECRKLEEQGYEKGLADGRNLSFNMHRFCDCKPTRNALRSEQKFLTYSQETDTWDVETVESCWDDNLQSLEIGNSHWLEISDLWPRDKAPERID